MGRNRELTSRGDRCSEEPSTSSKNLRSKTCATSRSNSKTDCIIWFVDLKVDEGDESSVSQGDIAFQKTVYSRLETCCLSPKWISEEECLRVSEKANAIFVLPVFAGRVFEHLCSINCRVYGALAVLSCLNCGERLPKWTHPIQSITLKDAVICFTQLEYSVRETQTQLVLRMDGIVSRDFNENVTHLVALEHNAKGGKYNAAVQRNVPIMSLEWLERAWDATTKFNEARFTDSDIIEIYRLQLFTGCLMTCSGVSLQERVLLGQLIEENGGKFKGEMERHKCTHLLTDLNSGEKYRKAREWGWDTIKIVRLAWLTKCIEKGCRLPENLYEPKVPVKCSTPKNSLPASPANLEVSAISGPRRMDATLEHSGTTFTPVLSDLKNETRAGAISVVEQTRLGSSRSLQKTNSRALDEIAPSDPIEKFNFSLLQPDDYLEGCRFYLCGTSKSAFSSWKRLATMMGGSIVYSVCDSITHVVVGNARLDLKILNETCVVVNCEWLLECAKAQKMISPSNYIHSLDKEEGTMCAARKNDTLCVEEAFPTMVVAPEPFDADTFADAEVFNSSQPAFAPSQTENRRDDVTPALRNQTRVMEKDKGVPTTSVLEDLLEDTARKPNGSSTSVPARGVSTLGDAAQAATTPCNKRVEALRSVVSQRLSKSFGSPLIDSPSQFLDPNKKFIPRFDLRKAHEYVDGLQSFEQHSIASEDPSWSESAIGRILEQAVTKTSRETRDDSHHNPPNEEEVCNPIGICSAPVLEQVTADANEKLASVESRTVSTPHRARFHSTKKGDHCLNLGSRKDEDGILPVSNEDKKRMIEHRLATLANHENNVHLPPPIKRADSRKRSHSKDSSVGEEPVAKRETRKTVSQTARTCDSLESMVAAGNIGWEEANQTVGTKMKPVRLTTYYSDAASEMAKDILEDVEVPAPKKTIPVVFPLDGEVMFVEKQNSAVQVLSKKLKQSAVIRGNDSTVDSGLNDQQQQQLRNASTAVAKAPYGEGPSMSRPAEACVKTVPQIAPVSETRGGPRRLDYTSDETGSSDCLCVGQNAAEKGYFTFILSSLDEARKKTCTEIISKLGGELCAEFNKNVQYLVCGDIVRNEKLLTSIACGLFVLQPEYIEESGKAGTWLEPEDFEWGNPKVMSRHTFSSEHLKMLAAACRRWRLKLSKNSPKRGAFFGWNVLLYCNRRRATDIGRIITFGGGAFVLRDDVDLADGFTHVLVERSKYWTEKELDLLVKMRMNCYAVDFIANYLMTEKVVEHKYFHPDYKQRLPQGFLSS